MVKFCSNCGDHVEEKATFCSKCGAALIPGSVPVQEQHIYVHGPPKSPNADIAIILGILTYLGFGLTCIFGLIFAYRAKKLNEPANKVKTAMILNWIPVIFIPLVLAIVLPIVL